MDSSNILGLFAVIATVAGIAVTIALFIISNIKSDMKSSQESLSQSNKNLWEALNKVSSELAAFKEHVALAHPREERVNEKLEFNKQHIDQALSGINHRLSKLESDQSIVIQHMTQISNQQSQTMSYLKELVKNKNFEAKNG
nr:hypothetical protein [Alteromonas macleodii]|tara:strand:- start:1129 stop:1554 length:426 start_codon:yes stop_codon:yes gene_type:complete